MIALELVPEVSADGGAWKILGILSKNRKECSIAQIGGMYQGITSVGIDDDSSPEVKKFIVNHAEISSLLVSAESAKEFCEVKKGDDAGLMAKLTNLIIIESDLSAEDKALIEEAGFTIHFWRDIIEKGREVALEPQT